MRNLWSAALSAAHGTLSSEREKLAGEKAEMEKLVELAQATADAALVAKVPDRLAQPLAAIARGDWLHYDHDQGGARFSPLAEITPSNVDKLEVAWEADVGPATPGPRNILQVRPINVGDALYDPVAGNFEHALHNPGQKSIQIFTRTNARIAAVS
jgi:glucose dehydrogenase